MKNVTLTATIFLSSCVGSDSNSEDYGADAVFQEMLYASKSEAVNEKQEQAFFDALAYFEGASFDEANTKLFFWSNYGSYEFLNYLDAEHPPKAVREYVHFWLGIENGALRRSSADIIWRGYLSRVH